MGHIERAFDSDLENIQNMIAQMAKKVFFMLENTIRALREKNSLLAKEIIQFDKEVDDLELRLDDAIYYLIALRQPAASDLRLVLASLKITADFERMGDYCEGICRQTFNLCQKGSVLVVPEMNQLGDHVLEMCRDCIEMISRNDVPLAKKIILADDIADELAHKIFDSLQVVFKTKPDQVEAATALLLINAKFERIADQMTNIAEEVVFTVTGDNIRHRSYKFAGGKK